MALEIERVNRCRVRGGATLGASSTVIQCQGRGYARGTMCVIRPPFQLRPKNPEQRLGEKLFNALTSQLSITQFTDFVMCFSNTFVTFIKCLERILRIDFTGTLKQYTSSKSQQLKAIENRYVFTQDLKTLTEGADLMSGGRVFQSLGTATGNA